jgi:hypothetical protein
LKYNTVIDRTGNRSADPIPNRTPNQKEEEEKEEELEKKRLSINYDLKKERRTSASQMIGLAGFASTGRGNTLSKVIF